MSNFAKRLRELRTSHELSQQKLANYLNLSKSSVNMYERAEREPGLETLEAIADFFNVDLDYLLGKSDIPNRFLALSDKEKEVLKLSNKQAEQIKYIQDHKEEIHEKILLDGYRCLDEIDQGKIWNTIRQMLKTDKYKK